MTAARKKRHPTYAFRNEVILALHGAGITSATYPPSRRWITPEERASYRPSGDVVGVGGWTLGVRSRVSVDLSDAVDDAAAGAAAQGNRRFATIQSRPGHQTAESYVTMPLSIFLDVLAELSPELVGERQSEHPHVHEQERAPA